MSQYPPSKYLHYNRCLLPCGVSRVLNRSCVKAPSLLPAFLQTTHSSLLSALTCTQSMSQLSADQAMIHELVLKNVPEIETSLTYDSKCQLAFRQCTFIPFWSQPACCVLVVAVRWWMMYYCEQSEHFKRWPSFPSICWLINKYLRRGFCVIWSGTLWWSMIVKVTLEHLKHLTRVMPMSCCCYIVNWCGARTKNPVFCYSW